MRDRTRSCNLGSLDFHRFEFGAAGEIRTPDTQVRSLVLYPAELRPPCARLRVNHGATSLSRLLVKSVNAFQSDSMLSRFEAMGVAPSRNRKAMESLRIIFGLDDVGVIRSGDDL